MAFSGSSYFAGMGTVVAAIAFGVACGSMVTTSVVQPANRLDRVNGGTTIGQAKRDSTPPPSAASSAEQASTAKPAPPEAPPAPVAAAASTVPAASAPAPDPQPAPPPQPAAPAAVKADAALSTQDQSAAAPTAKSPAPSTVAKSEDAAPAQNASGRAVDPNKDASRKKAATRKSSDDRKYSERRRRHDQDERQLDEATNVIRQMPRERAVGDLVEQDDGPRVRVRPRHFELFDDDGPPRRSEGPPPGLGFFGFGD